MRDNLKSMEANKQTRKDNPMSRTAKLIELLRVWLDLGLASHEVSELHSYYDASPDQIDIDYVGLTNLNLGD